ncbi:MAG: flagellin [Candidatus Sericytochromatia bacterium]|nr:flagellin [Candidatus Tanganyikabacteria bacterium]
MGTVRINTNVVALLAHRNLSRNDEALSGSLARLSSGLRINRSADDAAGLAIAEKMRGQTRGLTQASQNALDGISLIQTAEGALKETQAILQRMRTLAVQAANDALTDEDRDIIRDELTELSAEVDRIAKTTQFNTQNLLFGGKISQSGITLHIGANYKQEMNVVIDTATAAALGVKIGQLPVDSAYNASVTLSNLDTALAKVSSTRSRLGAMINRLEHTILNLQVQNENLKSAESRIRDLDMAQEMAVLTRAQVLSQASTAMLAQANQAPQSILSLLR